MASSAGETESLTRAVFSGQPEWARAAFYVLALLATIVFCYGIYRRARLWQRGRSTGERLQVADIAARLWRYALLQRRVRGRGLASVAHACLYAGFMILLLATTLLGIEHAIALVLGRDDAHPVFHKGLYFAVYEVISDLFGLALLVGCAWFLWRRVRGTSSIGRGARDWLVLGALVFLGISGYFVEGLRIVAERTPARWVSFVGAGIASVIERLGIDQPRAARVHPWVWWGHALVALGFVAALPYTRLLHAIVGAVRLGLPRRPLGTMALVDAASVEETGELGVGRIDQFTRLQMIELDACVSCGRCQDACPAFEAGKPLSPRDVVQNLRAGLDRIGPESAPLIPGVIQEATLWSCTACSACTDVCPLGIDPLGMITDMRRHAVAEGMLRGAPAASLQKMDRSGNPWGLQARERMAWARDLEVPTVAERPDFEVLYWVGCAAAYDARLQDTARSVVRVLHAASVKFAVLGERERCTGESARRMGDEMLWQQLAAANIETLKGAGVDDGKRPIIAHCPHCVNTFLRDYPQLGARYTVLHHTEYLARLAAEGRLPNTKRRAQRVTYHDPCYLARVGGVVEQPRALLSETAADADAIVEMPRRGVQTSCCGAGGGRMWFDDAPDARVGTSRVTEALATGAETIAVGCPFCKVMLGDGVAARGSPVAVKDIAELIAEGLDGANDPAEVTAGKPI